VCPRLPSRSASAANGSKSPVLPAVSTMIAAMPLMLSSELLGRAVRGRGASSVRSLSTCSIRLPGAGEGGSVPNVWSLPVKPACFEGLKQG
jgi:hypothetical protein